MDRLQTLTSYLAEDPTDAFLKYALASEYVKLGRDSDARRTFELLVQSDPDYIGTYYHLGKLYERISENRLAVDIYKKGISVANRISDTHARSELQSALLEAEGVGFD